MNKSVKYGYTPKMVGAAFIGYIFGKISYQNTCAEKLMKLPNSKVGAALRKRKGLPEYQEVWVILYFSLAYILFH